MGVISCASCLGDRGRSVALHAIGAPLNHAIMQQPYLREGLPEVPAYIQKNAQPGDHIHLYEPAERSFRF